MEIKEYVSKRKDELKKAVLSKAKVPTLAIIVVGNNPASDSYVRGKMKDASEVGFKAIDTRLDETVSQEELLSLIEVITPIPRSMGSWFSFRCRSSISEKAIHEAILPEQDVDGFSPGFAF
jgi:methylenetetrahydrofolate dehydrogenase (NADP+)/methenyltetrahydrofolate cyclohydrolase